MEMGNNVHLAKVTEDSKNNNVEDDTSTCMLYIYFSFNNRTPNFMN